MGCDIHIVIQAQDADGAWREIAYQEDSSWRDDWTPKEGIPLAPDVFSGRNYDLFAILADVRNGVGFAGIKTGQGWPSIAAHRELPEGFDENAVLPHPEYPDEGPRSLGDHSFTWVMLAELKAFPWDSISTTLYGVVSASDYERLSASGEAPTSYCGATSGPGIATYDPATYAAVKFSASLAERPHVRMSWKETAREATNDWPGKVLPWLDSLAAGRPLRLVLGFDS
jgi:hypothetical protein